MACNIRKNKEGKQKNIRAVYTPCHGEVIIIIGDKISTYSSFCFGGSNFIKRFGEWFALCAHTS